MSKAAEVKPDEDQEITTGFNNGEDIGTSKTTFSVSCEDESLAGISLREKGQEGSPLL